RTTMLNHNQLKDLLTREVNRTKKEGEVLLTAEEMSEFLEAYQGDDKIITSEEIAEIVKKEGIRQPMNCGIESLNEIIGGFYEEQVIVVSARPKSGKTSLVLHLIEKMKEKNPLLLALEQSSRELVEQLTEQGRQIPFFYT